MRVIYCFEGLLCFVLFLPLPPYTLAVHNDYIPHGSWYWCVMHLNSSSLTLFSWSFMVCVHNIPYVFLPSCPCRSLSISWYPSLLQKIHLPFICYLFSLFSFFIFQVSEIREKNLIFKLVFQVGLRYCGSKVDTFSYK